MKGESVMEIEMKMSYSWVMKNVLTQRVLTTRIQPTWNDMLSSTNFGRKKIYDKLMEADRVPWSNLLRNNCARPRAILTTWLACHGRLGTKDRLVRFGMITDKICSFCNEIEETLDHLLFECRTSHAIWKEVLHWIGVIHEPQKWVMELDWVLRMIGRKGWRAYLLKMAVTETIYNIWAHRNGKIFGGNTYRSTSKDITDSIIETIVYRGWGSKKLRKHIAALML
jgi:hypothetical protein